MTANWTPDFTLVHMGINADCAEEAKSVAEAYAGDGQVWFWDVNDMIDYCSTPGYKVRHISEFGLSRPPQSWCYVEEIK